MNIPPVGSPKSPEPFDPSNKEKKQSPYKSLFYSALTSSSAPFFKGALTGVVEVYIDQPLVTIKNEIQKAQQEKAYSAAERMDWRTINPEKAKKVAKTLWAGAGANATGMAAVTGAQMFAMNIIKEQLSQGGNYPLTPMQDVCASISAGVFASPLASVSELVMMHHNVRMKHYIENLEKHEKVSKEQVELFKKEVPKPSYQTTTDLLLKKYQWRIVTIGLGYTAGREGLFTLSYGYLSPTIKKWLKEQGVSNDLVATMVGGIAAGLIGGTISHPFDTKNTLKKMEKSQTPWMKSFSGWGARVTRIAAAITIYSLAEEFYRDLVNKLKNEKDAN